jgi:hypothetical protein
MYQGAAGRPLYRSDDCRVCKLPAYWRGLLFEGLQITSVEDSVIFLSQPEIVFDRWEFDTAQISCKICKCGSHWQGHSIT